jgi:hypothetical protein
VRTADRLREGGVGTRSRCPETSVNNYHTTPCNYPEDHRFKLLYLCLLYEECTHLFTINCVTQCYMFRTVSWFIIRDLSILNYTVYIDGTIGLNSKNCI